MPDGLKVEYLSYEDLRTRADGFLRRYHPSQTIPVPIEEIIDLQFKLDIVPMPGLKASFDVEAFITCDMATIYVDENTYSSRPTRYRFSLAHEIAHAVLHQKTYRAMDFHDLESWTQAQRQIPEKEYGWLEWQAYAFAGLVLVPGDALKRRFAIAAASAEQRGVSLKNASEAALHIVAGSLAREFDVSAEVIERRLGKDKLLEAS